MKLSRTTLLFVACLSGCDARGQATTQTPVDAQPQPPATPAVAPAPAPAPESPQPTATSEALAPGRGKEIGMVFEAFLSPHQEGGEEENTPRTTPKVFQSSTPSQSRAAREAAGHRGHGQLRFSNDLSRVEIAVKIEGIDPATINMFHIHCGKPGVLGPILVDFSLATDLASNIADGVFTVEIRNEHIVKTSEHVHGLVDAFTMGCLVPSPSFGTNKPIKVMTVAGMLDIALQHELYFNLHTTGQTYFGDIRGQIHPVARP